MTRSVYSKNELKADESDAWVNNDVWIKLLELFSNGAEVLDIGCSSGNFGKELIRQKQCRVVGIDINESDLKIAAKHLTKVFKKDIERDSLDDLGTFDYVLMADIIEHVIGPVPVLKKVKKLLKPGGKLIFSVPNMANIANRVELLGGRFEYTEYGMLDETHLHYYDRVELEKVLTQAGFSVEHYNNTIRDVPPTILQTQLKKLGLSANDTFLKMAASVDAITFQFIGVAKPTGQVAHRTVHVHSKTPYDFVSRQLDATRQGLMSEIDNAKTQAKELKLANAKLMRELQAIKNSKGWRMLIKLYGAKHKLSSVLRRK